MERIKGILSPRHLKSIPGLDGKYQYGTFIDGAPKYVKSKKTLKQIEKLHMEYLQAQQ